MLRIYGSMFCYLLPGGSVYLNLVKKKVRLNQVKSGKWGFVHKKILTTLVNANHLNNKIKKACKVCVAVVTASQREVSGSNPS